MNVALRANRNGLARAKISTHYSIVLVLIASAPIGACVFADSSTDRELLRPAGSKKNTTDEHRITYKLSDGSDAWDPEARARIIKAMDEAVAAYNKYGEFDRVLTANWNPGTPTADANFGGWINFGGQIGTRTALHEIAHALGIGTCPKWGEFARDGKWTGKYGIAQLKELDGPDAVLHCDRQHFWPYGLNYDNEGGPDAFKRNVMMVTAMRADMGLGPPPHPAAVALKTARAAAEAAHTAYEKALADFKQLTTKSQAELGSRPEVAQASAELSKAKSAYDAATKKAIESLHASSEYRAAQARADQARQKLDAAQADPDYKASEATTDATAALEARTELTAFQTRALATDAAVAATRKAYLTAAAALDAAREAAIKNDPEILRERNALAVARTNAADADQAVTTAAVAALKEENAETPPPK